MVIVRAGLSPLHMGCLVTAGLTQASRSLPGLGQDGRSKTSHKAWASRPALRSLCFLV
jgi:hypothetical protein